MSGLKINFHKSEIFCFGNAIEKSDFYFKILPAPLENCPLVIRFLKSPNGPKWKKILKKKLGVWQGRFLSLGGRLTLINNSLSNIPLYMLSVFFAPSIVLKNGYIQKKTFVARRKKMQKNIIWLDGKLFVHLKIEVVWESLISDAWILVF
jgi:hypothetical protein